MKNQMFAGIVEKMRNQFLPLKDDVARMTMDGTVVVRTNTANGKEWIGRNAAGETMAYPEEMIVDVPLYTVARTIDQVNVGDIVKATSSTYSYVEKIEDGKIHAISFGGNVRKVAPIKDFFLGQATVRVVVNPFAGAFAGNQNNMLPFIMFLGDNDNDGSMLEMLVLSQAMNPGAAGNIMQNPMTLALLMKDGGKDALLPLLFMQNGGNFNFFGTPCACKAKAADVEPEA